MAIAEQEIIGTKLPLDSLEIKNYRAFKELTIPKLARVNLITGKNNVGKTSLLEGISLYCAGGNPHKMRFILDSRDELSRPLSLVAPFGFVDSVDETAAWLPYIASLFHDRKSLFEMSAPLEIGPVRAIGDSDRVSVEVIWFRKAQAEAGSEEELIPVPIGVDTTLDSLHRAKPYVVVQAPGRPKMRFGFDEAHYSFNNSLYWAAGRDKDCYSLAPNGMSNQDVSWLWNRIALSDLEGEVIRALQVIAPDVERVTMLDDLRRSERVPFIKSTKSRDPFPLRRYGDGACRIFGLSLAITNHRNGIVLIDEVENGLHHSIQSQVWRAIFDLAQRLDVQVFATTHSWECIQAFERTLESFDTYDGMLIRLDSVDGNIRSTAFDRRRLKIVTEDRVEVR